MVLDRLSFSDNDRVLTAKPVVSKFRVKRIALEPHQVPYYYGLCALTSDAESGEEQDTTAPNRTKRRSSSRRRSVAVASASKKIEDTDSPQEPPACDTTSFAPSFRCSLSNSVFQSTYEEEGDSGELEEGLADLTKATQTDENPDKFPMSSAETNQLLKYSFPANIFQSNNAASLMELGPQFMGHEDQKEHQPATRLSIQQPGRQSTEDSEAVPPSFRCSLPVAAFQSHCEDAGDTVFEQLQHARQIYFLGARKIHGGNGLQTQNEMTRRTDQSLGSLPASLFQSTIYDSTNSLPAATTRTTFGEGGAQNVGTDYGCRGRSSVATNPLRASFPASAFQSTYYESIDQLEERDHHQTEPTLAPSSQETCEPPSSQETTKRPSFHCSLAKSAFQSTYLEDEQEEKKLPDSQNTDLSPPKFRSSLAGASVFQSTYCESTVGEEENFSKQLDQTEPAIGEHTHKHKENMNLGVVEGPARKSTILHAVKPNELINFSKPPCRPSALQALVSQLGTKQPLHFGVFEKQKSKRLSVDKAVQYSPPEIRDKDIPFKEMVIEEIEENSEDFGPDVESPDQTLSAEKLQIVSQPSYEELLPVEQSINNQLSQQLAKLSLPPPPPAGLQQLDEQQETSPLNNKENEKEQAVKTPSPDLPAPLKSALKRTHLNEPGFHSLRAISLNYNTPDRRKSVLFADKTFSQSPPQNTTQENSTMNYSLALEMENVRLNNTNLGDLSKISRGSLRHGDSLVEDDETFTEKVACEIDKVPNFADSSLWDAGGGCDYDDEDEEEPSLAFGSRTKEWPSVVDNSLGLEESQESSPTCSSNNKTDISTSSMAMFDTTTDNCFASPAVKHIVLRAQHKKPSPAMVLPKPKVLHNNLDSPSVVELGLRRSARNRLPRLNQALGQHPIYQRDAEGNETLVGANDVVIKDKLLKKHKVADPLIAGERDRQLKNRRRLQHDKKDELRKRRFQ